MKRYSIMVIEYGSDREIELCQTDTNPQMVVEGAKEKTLMVYKGPDARRRSKTCKYTSIRIVDHQEAAA
jgi:adenylate cyclase class IV